MRAFLARRDCEGRASQRLRQAKEWVDGQSSTKIVYWEVRREVPISRRRSNSSRKTSIMYCNGTGNYHVLYAKRKRGQFVQQHERCAASLRD